MSNPLPSELRENTKKTPSSQQASSDVVDYILAWYDELPKRMTKPPRGERILTVTAYELAELFNTEYLRRIEAAKPSEHIHEHCESCVSHNRAIDQYEHNLKQLSEGGK